MVRRYFTVARRCMLMAITVWATSMAMAAPGAASEQFDRTDIEKKLGNPVTLEFVETPIGQVIEFVRDYTKLNFIVDKLALEEEGVTDDTPITIHVRQIQLGSALKLMLAQLNLTYVVEDEYVLVTSRLSADKRVVAQAYSVADLAPNAEAGQTLVSLARRVLGSGKADYPSDRIVLLDSIKSIVLTDSIATHDRMSQLLTLLRGPAEPPESAKKIHTKLNDPITLNFVETPLGDIVEFLRDSTGVNIVLDRNALEEEGVTSDIPMTIHVQSLSLDTAMNVLLTPINLAWKIDNEVLFITSAREAARTFRLRGYSASKQLDARKLSRNEWMALAQSVIRTERNVEGQQTATMFLPGSRVRVTWGDRELAGSVLDIRGQSYLVRFYVDDAQRDEWLEPNLVETDVPNMTTPWPIVEFYEPSETLVVYGPEFVHKNMKRMIEILEKAAQ